MITKNKKKSENGKVIEVELDYSDNVIFDIKISGDFFAHPEDSIDNLQKSLYNAKKSDIEKIVTENLKDTQLFGIVEKDICSIIVEAMK